MAQAFFLLVTIVVGSVTTRAVVSEKVHLLADPALLEYTAAGVEITLGPVTKVGRGVPHSSLSRAVSPLYRQSSRSA